MPNDTQEVASMRPPLFAAEYVEFHATPTWLVLRFNEAAAVRGGIPDNADVGTLAYIMLQ